MNFFIYLYILAQILWRNFLFCFLRRKNKQKQNKFLWPRSLKVLVVWPLKKEFFFAASRYAVINICFDSYSSINLPGKVSLRNSVLRIRFILIWIRIHFCFTFFFYGNIFFRNMICYLWSKYSFKCMIF